MPCRIGASRDEQEIAEGMDRQIKEAKRAATVALTLEEKLAVQKQIKVLEMQRNEKRRSLFDAITENMTLGALAHHFGKKKD